jgi:7-carboxy-7-deazaguanine synthase
MSAPIDRDRMLRISEVYASVQGESTHVGKPCVFVRLTGCNLRCRWCDTTFSFTGGTWRPVEEVVAEALAFGIPTVEVTGGEPLVQRAAVPLMRALLDAGCEVLLETSGSRPIDDVPRGVHIILDLKAPDSGEARANLWENLERLRDTDEIKVVLASEGDYAWAADVVRTRRPRVPVLFSPVWGALDPTWLAERIVADRLAVRYQLQLHKVLWPAEARGV